MLSSSELQNRLKRILLSVQKPGRYVGGEWNSVVKDWDSVSLRLALVFPDIYDIGVSNLGLQILYDLVNARPDALAERAYAPWVDMEAQMRAHGIPLYSLESKRPLAEFDIIGFSLPYETLYTNVLNLLDLAGLPVRAVERDDRHPLIIAGGHACFNPEPMHAFIDAFVLGDGEEVIHEILEVVKEYKSQATPRQGREELLRRLARIPGVYVPRFYEVTYFEDGTVKSVLPTIPEAPRIVLKRMVAQLPPPPTRFIVPNIETVHNRIAIEIMRGCTRGCRFCHAGIVTRPVRERSVEEIVNAAEEAIRQTGFEELALLSLSSSDYTDILPLVEAIGERFAGHHLTISLPSLRIETVSVTLMEKLKSRRSGGFTLAPEAASERMRRIINKFIPDEQILETAREIYRRGWTTIKLYFMIGHPSETLEDVRAIADLCKRVLAEGRKTLGGRAKVHAGVSTFVPKPHTPFQWVSMDTPEQIIAKQDLLKRELRDRNIKLTWTEPTESMLEAWLSRGDRRMAEVVYTAWRNGATFDAWQDQLRYQTWLEAFATHGLDPAFYTHRPRRPDEVFPWDHLSTGVRKNYLFGDFRRSLEGDIRIDCRNQCYACGILPTFADERRQHPGPAWKCPEVKSPASSQQPGVSNQTPLAGD
ncbi:MAG: TIGR03960 family B12-binding radical SAM protein [Anaerolineales bacterium]|nr:TIGR03960 family B12-binding radical SAM protein [Anaerolineales bacterium]